MDRANVLVIGGGPAGLAFAARLKRLGIDGVTVLEREQAAGGIPRHCGHWGFGWESHRTLRTGPAFAEHLRREAAGVDVRIGHTVLKLLGPSTVLVHAAARGTFEMAAKHIVYACGARETTRAARMVGGIRNPAVMNTGTLQQLVYLKGMRPFERPVIIGTEWLSFSALMTCKHAAIKPVAMIAEERQLQAPTVFAWGARLWYGVPMLRETHVLAIEGGDTVTGVRVRHGQDERVIACDGVIVSGQLVPEDGVLRSSGPQTADIEMIRIGNMQGEIKTAGRCVAEARRQAEVLAGRFA